ncbi:MAG: methyltransferase domain-containing protein [Planctomycetes bacterium]|nr:methyltransferase domain-containing protein [Planctomycetota bacterium]
MLRRLNSFTRAARHLIHAIESRIQPAAGDSVSMIDFGAGIGDIARSAIESARGKGWGLRVHATDRNPDVVEMCRAAGSGEGMTFQQVDILGAGTTFAPGSFDVAHASLMLHHLLDADVVEALRGMAHTATKLVVWNDLLRSRIGLLGARLATLGSSRIVRDDAMLSVRRSFTLEEALSFAQAAGLEEIELQRRKGARFVLCARPPAKSAPDAQPKPRLEAIIP